MVTVAELAKAWLIEVERTEGTEGIGDLLSIDRALIDARVETPEDLAALLDVVIRDFQIHHATSAIR